MAGDRINLYSARRKTTRTVTVKRAHLYDNHIRLWLSDDLLRPIDLPPDSHVSVPPS